MYCKILARKFINSNTRFRDSISVLNSSDKEELISEFKAIYTNNGTDNLVSQVPYLSRLAEHYEATAALDGNDWVNLLKVCDVSAFY